MNGDARPVFLVGFMGSGKSAVGRSLAELMDREFLDTDQLISEREGRSIEAIFAGSGEERFRVVEWEVLQQLSGQPALVVATGGGLFIDHDRRRWLKRQGRTVWIDAPLEVVRGRLGDQAGRPLWDPSDLVAQRALYDKRRATYALADIRVDGTSGDPGEVARRVLKRLVRISS